MEHILNKFPKSYPFIIEGFVMDTDDPDQMGRLKIWCPSIDGDTFQIDTLPWAEYASPFCGITTDFPTGRTGKISNGHVAYGFWSIPKLNAQVLVFLLNGNPNRRFFFAGYNDLHRNRSLPGGRNLTPDPPEHRKQGPWTDTYEALEPAYSNLRLQFNDDVTNPIAQTRGATERQVAQALDEKDGKEGYADAAADPQKYKDPQTYCWVTPGHHFISMTDNPDNCHVRVKTCEGHQVIMDDTNERIYISTARGNTWIELDEDGHIHIYGGKSISMRAEEDINITAGRNINLHAEAGINLKAAADIREDAGNIHMNAAEKLAATSCTSDISAGKVRISGDLVDIKSAGPLTTSGYPVTANSHRSPGDEDNDRVVFPGGDAADAECAVPAMDPSIIPAHEPWHRPQNKNRNSRYKG